MQKCHMLHCKVLLSMNPSDSRLKLNRIFSHIARGTVFECNVENTVNLGAWFNNSIRLNYSNSYLGTDLGYRFQLSLLHRILSLHVQLWLWSLDSWSWMQKYHKLHCRAPLSMNPSDSRLKSNRQTRHVIKGIIFACNIGNHGNWRAWFDNSSWLNY